MHIFCLSAPLLGQYETNNPPIGGHDHRDVLLEFNSEGWPQREGGGRSFTWGALGNIAAQEREKQFRERVAFTNGVAYVVEGLAAA